MIWRKRLLQTTSYQISKSWSLVPIRNISSPFVCSIDETQSTVNPNQEIPESCKTILTKQIVQSTLLNCPSDLVALSFFLWCARQPNYFHDRCAFDRLASVVARLALQLKTVKRVIDQLKSVGCVIKPQTFLLLLRIYWHGRMYNLVFEAFEEMINLGYAPNTFARNIVMDVLFKIGCVDAALGVLKESQFPNFLTFGIVIYNLCKLNDLINVQNVLRNMLRKGYYLNGETSLMVINCYCKMGRLAEAFQVLGLMISLGISTSVNTWSILIDGFCKSGRLGMASYLLEKMMENGCSPNVVTFTPLIKVLMESQMASSAFGILSTLERMGFSHDLVLSNVLIDCYSKMGRYDDALDVFFSMLKRNILPDSYTFCSLMSTVFVSRQFDLLPILISGLAINADMVVCNRLLIYFCKAGYPFGAVELYNDMIDRGFIPDRYSYVGLLCGLCGMGRVGEAVNVYRGIVMNNLGHDAYIHTVMMSELIKAGKFHKAVNLFRKAFAEKYPLDVVSYTVAIDGLFKGGRAGEACTLYSQMKEVGVAPNEHTYRIMLSGLCRERDVNTTEQILREMIDAGIQLDYNTFNMINDCLFKSRHSRSAFDLFTKMWDSRLMPNKDMFAHGVSIGDPRISLLKGNLVDVLDVDTSGSEDLSDAAASVG